MPLFSSFVVAESRSKVPGRTGRPPGAVLCHYIWHYYCLIYSNDSAVDRLPPGIRNINSSTPYGAHFQSVFTPTERGEMAAPGNIPGNGLAKWRRSAPGPIFSGTRGGSNQSFGGKE